MDPPTAHKIMSYSGGVLGQSIGAIIRKLSGGHDTQWRGTVKESGQSFQYTMKSKAVWSLIKTTWNETAPN